MREQDFERFSSLIESVAEFFSKNLSITQKAMYFRALAKYSIDDVQAALDAHISDQDRGRFMPLPADVIAKAERVFAVNDGRPTAEQAWAIAIVAVDPDATVVWTEETAQAWSCVSCFYTDGRVSSTDEYNASRAFKDTYDRLVSENRANRVQAKWTASLGDDKDLRQQAVEQALSKNLIKHSQAKHWLPNHTASDGAYAAIKSTVSLMIENKGATENHHLLDRIESLKTTGAILQKRLSELKKAAGIENESRVDGTKSKRDSLVIFEDADRLGVFKNDKERKEWCAKAANGENLKELQAMMLIVKSERKAGAA